jgi:nucleoside-diphosphate-sugar epimerase
MKVLITGVAGQVGSHVADALLSKGDQVLGIDNFATGREIHLPKHENFKFISGTIGDKDLIAKLFSEFKPDSVVHAAASYKDPENWEEDLSTNSIGGLNLIRASMEHHVSRFIYFQTALIYGVQPLTNPIRLDHPKRVDNSSYSLTKGVTEDFLTLSGLSHVVFRLANVIGDRCVSGPLPIFYQRLVDGKRCFVTPARRDFVYVGDLVRATLTALTGVGSGAYHFSSGADFAIQELYDEVAHSLGINPVPEPEWRDIASDEASSILLDPSRTFKDFGQLEFTPLRETVRRAISYYQEFGTEGEYTHLKANN